MDQKCLNENKNYFFEVYKIDKKFLNLIIISKNFNKENFYIYISDNYLTNTFRKKERKEHDDKKEKIFEIFSEESFFQFLIFIYLYEKNFSHSDSIFISKIFLEILALSIEKKLIKHKKFCLDLLKLNRYNIKQNFNIFQNFQMGKLNQTINLDKILFYNHNFVIIDTVKNFVIEKRGKIILENFYKYCKDKKSKNFIILYAQINSILNVKNNTNLTLKSKIRTTRRNKEEEKRFVLRDQKISPSIIRFFKIYIYNISIYLRNKINKLSEKSISFVIFLLQLSNMSFNFLYFSIYKYFRFFRKSENIGNFYDTKSENYKNKKNFFFQKYHRTINWKFSFSFFEIKRKEICLPQRKVNPKILNWIKNTSFILKGLNNMRFFRKQDSFLLYRGLDKEKEICFFNEKLIYIKKKFTLSIYNRFPIIQSFKKSVQKKYIDEKILISFINLKNFIKKYEFLNVIGVLFSLICNVRYNEKNFPIIFHPDLSFKLETSIFRNENVKKIIQILYNMKQIEKKIFIRVFKLSFSKSLIIFKFLLEEFLNVGFQNVKFLKKNEICIQKLCLNTFELNKNYFLKFHRNNLFLLKIFQIFTPFFYRKTKNWMLNFYKWMKIFGKFVLKSLFFYKKAYDFLENFFLFDSKINIVKSELTRNYKPKKAIGFVFKLALFYSEKKKILSTEIDNFLSDFKIFYRKNFFPCKIYSIFLFSCCRSKIYKKFLFPLKFFFSFVNEKPFLVKFELKFFEKTSILSNASIFLKQKVEFSSNHENSTSSRDYLFIENIFFFKFYKK
jgi:hypothetical protein